MFGSTPPACAAAGTDTVARMAAAATEASFVVFIVVISFVASNPLRGVTSLRLLAGWSGSQRDDRPGTSRSDGDVGGHQHQEGASPNKHPGRVCVGMAEIV